MTEGADIAEARSHAVPARPAPAAEAEAPLYASRTRIYPRRVSGTFRRIKWAVLAAMLGLYYVLPWLRWDRGPDAPGQAILLDMPGRRAYFFAVEIWPQEVYYLAGLLILGAVGLFWVTAVAGRVWCGFTCPQTLWTDLFMWIERLIEGDRSARMRRDRGPRSLDKAARKTAKHAAWLVIAFATGGVWICYYADAPTVTREFFTGQASATVYGFAFLFTATTYVLAGWAREQVCIYMCPWPRFQAAMFDEHSLVVTYEAWRGEPRGSARRGQSFEGRGHCIDCTMCVQVCPTGVDIRRGQQLACIGCALCADACNAIMDKMGLPRDLITYDSVANQVGRARGQATRIRTWRPRTLVYAGVFSLIVAIIAVMFATRETTEINVLGDRAPLFVTLSNGSIRDGYVLKVINKERRPRNFTLAVRGPAGATLGVIGHAEEGAATARLPVAADSVGAFRVLVTAPRASLADKTSTITFVLEDQATGAEIRRRGVFIGPGR